MTIDTRAVCGRAAGGATGTSAMAAGTSGSCSGSSASGSGAAVVQLMAPGVVEPR